MKSSTGKVWVNPSAINSAWKELSSSLAFSTSKLLTLNCFVIGAYFGPLVHHLAVLIQAAMSDSSECVKKFSSNKHFLKALHIKWCKTVNHMAERWKVEVGCAWLSTYIHIMVRWVKEGKGGEEEVWELERNPINARTGFVRKQVSRLHFPHCVFWTPYMKALHHLVKKFAFQWLRNLVKVKDGWMNK